MVVITKSLGDTSAIREWGPTALALLAAMGTIVYLLVQSSSTKLTLSAQAEQTSETLKTQRDPPDS